MFNWHLDENGSMLWEPREGGSSLLGASGTARGSFPRTKRGKEVGGVKDKKEERKQELVKGRWWELDFLPVCFHFLPLTGRHFSCRLSVAKYTE